MRKRKLFGTIAILLTCAMFTACATPTSEPTSTPAGTPTTAPEEVTNVSYKVGEVSTYNAPAADYGLSIDASKEIHDISELLYGIFFEDINFASDGGLYAEMVYNRSFEFNHLALNDEKFCWTDVGSISATVIKGDKEGCLNINNPNYMLLKNDSAEPAGVRNKGFLEGMCVKADTSYNFSVYAKGMDGYTGPLHVSVIAGNETVASGEIKSLTSEWKKYELSLTSSKSATRSVYLVVTIDKGSAAIDMVSLFPAETYKGRENGLRKDLAEKLEALKPKFLRFPGGCVIEGISLELAYDWKDSIGVDENGDPLLFNGNYGDVAARKLGQNLWTNESLTNDAYPVFMTYGLGFYEYFLLSEDIGAIGVPVLNCGIAC
ncbi:MAG: hypothetical protein K6B75_02060, partial [Lachnospiraceae bacterium]|nr:hypothetical protein [Lachnospiraceae bacterium]